MSGLFKKIAGAFVVMDNKSSDEGGPMGQSDIDRILAETRKMTGVAPPEPDIEAPEVPVAPTPVPRGNPDAELTRDFGTIYAEAGVPGTPKTAEQLLAIMEGFKALGPEATKVAIAGLDQAETNWSIEDPLLDATHKVNALKAEKARVASNLAAKEARASELRAKADKALEEATATIKAQIAEMEALLQEETAQATQHKADIELELGTARDTVTREAARLDAEIARLSTIPSTFGGSIPKVGG